MCFRDDNIQIAAANLFMEELAIVKFVLVKSHTYEFISPFK